MFRPFNSDKYSSISCYKQFIWYDVVDSCALTCYSYLNTNQIKDNLVFFKFSVVLSFPAADHITPSLL